MKFQKGHPGMGGRPKGANGYMIGLYQAIRSVRNSRPDKKDIIVHFIQRAYESDDILKCLITKLVPDSESAKALQQLLVSVHTNGSSNGEVKVDKNDAQFAGTMRGYLKEFINNGNGTK